MTDIGTREVIFRAAIDAASMSFDRGISTAAGMIREYIPVDELIEILGLTEEDFLRAFPALTDGGK